MRTFPNRMLRRDVYVLLGIESEEKHITLKSKIAEITFN